MAIDSHSRVMAPFNVSRGFTSDVGYQNTGTVIYHLETFPIVPAVKQHLPITSPYTPITSVPDIKTYLGVLSPHF